MSGPLTGDDDGKQVVTSNGQVVGWVEYADDGTAFVRPRPEFVANYGSLLTSCWGSNDRFQLDESAITAVEDDAVRIQAQ